MTRLQRWVMYALTAFAVIDLVAFSILPQQPYAFERHGGLLRECEGW